MHLEDKKDFFKDPFSTERGERFCGPASQTYWTEASVKVEPAPLHC